ncbi:MAG: D-2-hydroxyacid dehydrogenase family protein [Variovorax sp.]|nr:D-2-hydroxyacid dehydrogenase family protein [Variovorax sp.]
MVRIAILDDLQGEALQLAAWQSLPAGTQVQSLRDTAADEDELVRRLTDFEVVVAMRERTAFPASVIERLPNLRLLASTGLRNAAIDLAACRRRGVVVTGSRGSSNGRGSTCEIAWALILALSKKLLPSHQALHDGRWQPLLAGGLMGNVLGLAGLGNVGSRMAQVGRAFGMEVIAWSPNLTTERAAQHGAKAVSCDALFAQADIVSLHLVLSERTAGLVSGDRLAQMKPDALLVNTARAALVDEQALLQALRQRRIAGAGLDVFWQEPLPAGHPLLTLDNVVLTPHLGYATRDNLRAFYGGVVANILAWLEGRPLLLLQDSEAR